MKPELTIKPPVFNFEQIGCACALGSVDGKKNCCKKYKKKGKFCGGCPKK